MPHEVFRSDPQLARCWQTAQAISDGQVAPDDLIQAALLLDDDEIKGLIEASLATGQQFSEVETLLSRLDPGVSESTTGEKSCSPATQETLHEFQRARADLKLEASSAQLQLLCACALSRLSTDFRERWRCVDWNRAVDAFRKSIAVTAVASAFGNALLEGIQKVASETELGQQSGNGQSHHQGQAERPADAAAKAPDASLAQGMFEDITARLKQGTGLKSTPFDDDPAFGLFFDQLARVLFRDRTRHVLLVAERGVGQGLVIAEFARRMAAGSFPFLKDCRVLCTNVRHTPRGASLQTLTTLLNAVVPDPHAIAFIDGIAALLRGEGTGHHATLLSLLSFARCRVIGVVEPWEYEELVSLDVDMLEHFERLDLKEPDYPTAVRLVRRLADGLTERYGCQIPDQAVSMAVGLSANYILNEQLPGKALRVLHRLCEDFSYDRAHCGKSANAVTEDDVIRVISTMAGVPQETLRGIAEHVDYERSLNASIFGQDHAVAEVATELGLIKAGLSDFGKPASVMLFIGQTGTGKTELAKVLARFYSSSKRLKTYTLGNFVEPHSVAGIIGVPPGYVGHDQGGRLVNDLNSDPYCVFLLDEVDKAHPDVLQPFLNLFDEGWVRDQRGVQARADKAIFVLTTNVGQRMIAEMSQQGKSIEEITARMKEALSQIRHGKSNRPVFTPEFLARIKRIVVFKPLAQNAIEQITDKLVAEMQATWLDRRQKQLRVDPAIVSSLAAEAHRLNEKSDGREGGRIVRKLISDRIEAPLQRAISQQPEQYRMSAAVVVEISPAANQEPATDGTAARLSTVRFE
jgi:ATP-dependent Clp protease ATP-binding subunit ClpA